MEVVCLYRNLKFVAACLAIVYLQIIMHACFILVLIYLAMFSLDIYGNSKFESVCS